MNPIETERVHLIPHLPNHSLALMRSIEDYESLTGMKVAHGLGDFFTSGDVSPEFVALIDSPHSLWIHGFAIADRAEGLVVGVCGFKGPPERDGSVEIAYGIAPAYQNRGLATEAAAALTDFAFADARARLVIAHTLPEPNASTRVLSKSGFTFVGEVVDPEDGPVWRWELLHPSSD